MTAMGLAKILARFGNLDHIEVDQQSFVFMLGALGQIRAFYARDLT
jgi:hypothetical protein